ncbi:MAG: alpha/beta hydrolase family protein [Planctomycetes bacterium]|nr:alpha/beta hydrolase family protein [Planctomycetota bacterium]
MRCLLLPVVLAFLASPVNLWALSPEEGKITFKPGANEKKLPERYQLAEFSFDFKLKLKCDLPISNVEIYTLTFPSSVKSPHPENNTVWAEYYRPKGKGPFPGVIVLDILGGDQGLSRNIARHLAQNGVAALFVQMAYYGPRRGPNAPRLLTPNIDHTMAAIRQTVFDCRCATSWLESRPEIDAKKLGILGTSLGSFMSALTAAMEPRLDRVVLLLGGGGLVDAFIESPRAAPYLMMLQVVGLTRDKLKTMIAPADPLTYADLLKERKLLMIAASRDDVVPPKAAKTLWEATGKQQIIWLDATHVGAALYVFDMVGPIVKHFQGN